MLNQWVGIGRLKAKPELRKTNASGTSVCSFTLAVQRDVSKTAEKDVVDWINCVAWGSTAEQITKYFDKGDPIVVHGRLQTRDWEDLKGGTRTATEVVVDRWYYSIKPRSKSPDVEVDESAGSSPSRPGRSRFAEVADDGDLPF